MKKKNRHRPSIFFKINEERDGIDCINTYCMLGVECSLLIFFSPIYFKDIKGHDLLTEKETKDM